MEELRAEEDFLDFQMKDDRGNWWGCDLAASSSGMEWKTVGDL
jgi:hypothetical protein